VPRAFWKGTISFGLVAIPVRMSVATRSKTPAFHLLHKKDLSRPQEVLFCPLDNEYFSRKDTVRGYEYAKGQYVPMSDEDLKNVPVRTTRTIEIMSFIDANQIDSIYHSASHYVEPEELGAKPFALLREALIKTGRVGVAKVAFQRREHLCSLRPLEGILLLQTMHYADEILPRGELVAPPSTVNEKELEMAVTLINAMARDFKPEEYRDEYTEALQKIVKAKVEGQKIEAPVEANVEIEDLMTALRTSIQEAQKTAVKS
jgi:DNA end-binding protein Ku